MNQQNNIDDLFKNSAQQFSAPAPKRAWANIDGVLKRKRRVILFQKVLLAAATVVIIASVAFFVNIDNTTAPQFVDGNLDTPIVSPIIKTNSPIEDTKTDVVNNESINKNKKLENKLDIEQNSNVSNNNFETEIVNINTPLEETPESNINNNGANNNIVNKAPKSNTQEINIEKEVATTTVIAKNSEVKIKIEENFNNPIPEEIENADNQDVGLEIAEVNDNNNINKETTVKEINKELNSEVAATGVAVNESASDILKSNTIKQETTEIAKTEKLTQATEVVVSIGIEPTTPEVEEPKVEGSVTTPIEVVTPNSVDVETAIAEASALEKERAKARAAISMVPKKLDIDFIVSQTYGISVTNGIGKTPEIDNPSLSEAGATKAKTWFSAAVNIELAVNKWVVKFGVRRYNLEVDGDFEVKQKNPWNVDLNKYAFSELGYIKILNINSNLRLAKPSSIIYIQDFDHYDLRVRYIDIPLSVGYKFRRNRLSLVPHVGVNYTMAYSNEVELSSEDGYYMFGVVTGLKELMIGVTAGCGAYYDISKHLMVGIDTEMVYYPSSVSTNETFSYKPYSLLVGPSIAFKF